MSDVRRTGGAAPARPAPAVGGSTYTVVSGDTMSGIAARHGVSLARLIAANPQIPNANLIYPGQVLTLPSDATGSAPLPTVPVGPPSGNLGTNIDALIDDIAASLGIEPATARAVLQVESSGSGFVGGKLKIRFESHIFAGYARPAVAANHNGQSGEWSAFEAALAVNREAAFKSISMGAGQIMGFNHARVGYPSAEAMFNAFADPETGAAAQIKAMFDFIASDSRLLRAAQRKDWATFALYYNGAGYMNHTPPYDERLRNAYESFSSAVAT